MSTLYRVRSLALQPLSAEFSQADNLRIVQRKAMNLTSLDSLGYWESIYVYFKPQNPRRNMKKITLKTNGTQSSIYFSRASIKWPEKRKYRAFNVLFQISLLNISTM